MRKDATWQFVRGSIYLCDVRMNTGHRLHGRERERDVNSDME